MIGRYRRDRISTDGSNELVNVHMDSGAAMIIDVAKAVMYG